MKGYHQLTQEQRYHIECCLKRGDSQKAMALDLGVSESTISREIKRNGGKRGYRYKQADGFARKRCKSRHRGHISDCTWALVEDRLRNGHSPESISGRLKLEGYQSVSYERIYRYIYDDRRAGGVFYRFLHCQRPRRKKRFGKADKRGQIPDRVSIERRPPIVDLYGRTGDWEIDLVVGANHQGFLVTIVERSSGVNLAAAVPSKSADVVARAVVNSLMPYRDWVHTITSDNGKEFAMHKFIAEHLDCDFYFAHPYHSWERGCNENSNGRLRRYFPRGISFKELKHEEVNNAVEQMLNTPRKMLDYCTPREVFLQETNLYVSNNSRIALQG